MSPHTTLDESAARIADNAEQIADELRASSQEVQAFVGQAMESRPYTTLGAALAIGWVLGGGVPKTVTTLALGVGSRVAMTWLASNITQSLPGAHAGAPHATGTAGAHAAHADGAPGAPDAGDLAG